MEGNSICAGVSYRTRECKDAPVQMRAAEWHWGTYEALVFGQKHGNAGVDFADSQRDEHGAWKCGCETVVTT